MMITLADRVSAFLQRNRIYEVLGLFILFIMGIMLLEGGAGAEMHLFGQPITKMTKTTFICDYCTRAHGCCAKPVPKTPQQATFANQITFAKSGAAWNTAHREYRTSHFRFHISFHFCDQYHRNRKHTRKGAVNLSLGYAKRTGAAGDRLIYF